MRCCFACVIRVRRNRTTHNYPYMPSEWQVVAIVVVVVQRGHRATSRAMACRSLIGLGTEWMAFPLAWGLAWLSVVGDHADLTVKVLKGNLGSHLSRSATTIHTHTQSYTTCMCTHKGRGL